MLSLYLLLSLPGVIAAVLVRLWALDRKWDRSTRAWLVAMTVGLLCSPGVSVGGAGIPAVVPSILALILSGGEKRDWKVFVISSAVTTFIALVLYEVASSSKDRTEDKGGAEQSNSPPDS